MVKLSKPKVIYVCQACKAEMPRYLGRCPECESWNSIEEKVTLSEGPGNNTASALKNRLGLSDIMIPQLLRDIPMTDNTARYTSGYPELDRVLGGGFIPGGYYLFGGDPGIGKSTLMLQVAEKVALNGRTVLYVAGEESPHQIKLRAQRLGLTGDRILIVSQTDIHQIQEELKTSRPDLVVIDSIQSVYDPDLSGTPGNTSQIRECAGQLMTLAKALSITILLVGHVTKEGNVSGPKLLEHTVDAVLYFEGEQFRNLRILRSVKNRFGSTNEIGVFEIGQYGLAEVINPSELFLSESSYQHQPGSVITATVEGNRPLLVEIQALTGLTTYASPRRVANGIDLGRLHQIVAVLERRLGMDFSKQDIYVNVVGGLRIQEPAADLAIALALVSSSFDVSITDKTVISGEVGLTGEVRPVGQHDARVSEAQKLGFSRIILPKTRERADESVSPPVETGSTLKIKQIEIKSLMDALTHCLDRKPSLPQDQKTSHRNPEAEALASDGDLSPCPTFPPLPF